MLRALRVTRVNPGNSIYKKAILMDVQTAFVLEKRLFAEVMTPCERKRYEGSTHQIMEPV